MLIFAAGEALLPALRTAGQHRPDLRRPGPAAMVYYYYYYYIIIIIIIIIIISNNNNNERSISPVRSVPFQRL